MAYFDSAGVKLYYEDIGSGQPIVFVHEYATDCRAWEAQVRYFSHRFRCVAFNARGYEPSDVPKDDAAYAYTHFAEDIARLIAHLELAPAYVVGLSMGAYAALIFGLRHRPMAKGLVVAGVGSGAPRQEREAFKANCKATAERILKNGMPVEALTISKSPTRAQLLLKDPRGFAEYLRHLQEHSSLGSAMTMRNYQGGRPSLFDFEAEFAKLELPVLLAVGDEDGPCLETNLFLKRVLPASGLWICPRTGHGINLEEPAAFNAALDQFFLSVELGRWGLRDPRTRPPAADSTKKQA